MMWLQGVKTLCQYFPSIEYARKQQGRALQGWSLCRSKHAPLVRCFDCCHAMSFASNHQLSKSLFLHQYLLAFNQQTCQWKRLGRPWHDNTYVFDCHHSVPMSLTSITQGNFSQQARQDKQSKKGMWPDQQRLWAVWYPLLCSCALPEDLQAGNVQVCTAPWHCLVPVEEHSA